MPCGFEENADCQLFHDVRQRTLQLADSDCPKQDHFRQPRHPRWSNTEISVGDEFHQSIYFFKYLPEIYRSPVQNRSLRILVLDIAPLKVDLRCPNFELKLCRTAIMSLFLDGSLQVRESTEAATSVMTSQLRL